MWVPGEERWRDSEARRGKARNKDTARITAKRDDMRRKEGDFVRKEVFLLCLVFMRSR